MRMVNPKMVFVGGLPYDMDAVQLGECLSQFGVVKCSKIIYDQQGYSRGYGFVTYYSKEVANKAISERVIYHHGKRLNLSPALGKKVSSPSKVEEKEEPAPCQTYESNNYQQPAVNGYVINPYAMQQPTPYITFLLPYGQ